MVAIERSAVRVEHMGTISTAVAAAVVSISNSMGRIKSRYSDGSSHGQE